MSYFVSKRDAPSAHVFMQDVASRLANRVQLTTDALKSYLDAVEDAFGGEVNYAKLVKLFGPGAESTGRYSPAEDIGTRKERMMGNPDKAHVSTSYIERQNFSMRMRLRRFTRLKNAFSEKMESHEHAIALTFTHYNFVRIDKTLKCSSAMSAALTGKLWEISDIITLIEAADAPAAKRSPYKPCAQKVAA